MMVDATCAPANIRYPQDVSLLNEAREKLETILYRFHKAYGLPLPRRYRRKARKDYLAFVKSRKHTNSRIRKALRKQLGYVARDIRYLEQFMSDGYALERKEISLYLTVITLYGQQKYMYDNEIAIFKNRIEIYNPGAFPANKTPESYVMGNQRPIRRNPLIARTLYYSKDMESFATGLKRIKDACDKAGCRVEFETPDDGFVVVFYRHGIQKLSGTAQKTAQKEDKTAQKIAQKEERINALLEYCKEPRGRDEMMEFLGIKHRTTFRSDYLNPLLDDGKIAMTIPDKPRSKNQKFYSV